VESQMKDASSLFNRLRGLIALRKENEIFNSQEMDFLFRENKGLFAVLRGSRQRGLLCIHNLTGSAQKVDLKGYNAQLLVRSANQPAGDIALQDHTLLLEPYAYVWLQTSA
jgi:maltose alpha-D-glucosyltransferase/alpha-amylase